MSFFTIVTPMKVSIHASAREATLCLLDELLHDCVSIHASAREATFPTGGIPTPDNVSIHASAREATT